MSSLRKIKRFSHQRKLSTFLACVLFLSLTLLLIVICGSPRPRAAVYTCCTENSPGISGGSRCPTDDCTLSSRDVPLRLRNTTTKDVIEKWIGYSRGKLRAEKNDTGIWTTVPTAELTTAYRRALLAAASLPSGVCASIPHEWHAMSRIEMESQHCSQRSSTQQWKSAVAAATTALMQNNESNMLQVNFGMGDVHSVPVVRPLNGVYDKGVTLFLQGTKEDQARCTWTDKLYNVGRSYQPECFMLCMQHGFDALLYERDTNISVNVTLYLPIESRTSDPETSGQLGPLSYIARPAYVPRLFPHFSMEILRQSAYTSTTDRRVSLSRTAVDVCHENQKHVDVPQCLLAGYRESSTGARPVELKVSALGKLQHPSVLVIGHSHGRYMASSLCQMLRIESCMLFPQVKTSILSLFPRDVPFDVLSHGYAALAADAAQLMRFAPSAPNQYTAAEQSMIEKLARLHASGLLNGSRHVEREAEEQLRGLLDNDLPLLTFAQSIYSSVMKVERVERFFDEEVFNLPISEQTKWYVNVDPKKPSKHSDRKTRRTPEFTHVVFARGTWDALLRDLSVEQMVESYMKSILILLERFPLAKIIVSLMHYHHEAGGGYGDLLAHLWRQHCFARNQLDKFRAVTLCAAHKAQRAHEQRRVAKRHMGGNGIESRPIHLFDMWYPSVTDFSRSLVCSTGHHYRDTVMESMTMMLVNQQFCPVSGDEKIVGKATVDGGAETPLSQGDMLGRVLTAERGEAACAALESAWHEKPSFWCGAHVFINESTYMKSMFGGNVPPLDVDDETYDLDV